MTGHDDNASHQGDSSWEAARNLVEPIVAELDAPRATLLDLHVVIPGDDTVELSAAYHGAPTAAQRAALLRYAARIVEDASRRAEGHGGAGGRP